MGNYTWIEPESEGLKTYARGFWYLGGSSSYGSRGGKTGLTRVRFCTEDVRLCVRVYCTVDVSKASTCKSDLTNNLQSWALRKSVYVTLLVVGYKAIFVCPTASATRPAIVCSCDSSQWVANWLILPEVICLSQRLSHACVSSHWLTVKLRTAHYNSTNLFGCSTLKG